MKKKADLVHYLQTITDILQATEDMGGNLNSYFDLANGVVTDKKELSADQYAQIQESFSQGIEVYQQNMAKLEKISAPVAIIGPHKQLVKAYRDFVAGCEKMHASIDYSGQKIDGPAFKESEQEQSDAMDHVNAHIGRIMQRVG